MQQRTVYDVCIVGSGAGGGMAAYALTQAGANVIMLEAGGPWDNTSEDSAMLRPNYSSPRRGGSTPDRPFGEFDACIGGWNIEGEPYTRADGTRFDWWRARMVGGRTNHWGRISLRFGPNDFNPKSRDGLGHDWPITYDDLAPWYDRTEKLIGVTGAAPPRGLTNTPDSPPGARVKLVIYILTWTFFTAMIGAAHSSSLLTRLLTRWRVRARAFSMMPKIRRYRVSGSSAGWRSRLPAVMEGSPTNSRWRLPPSRSICEFCAKPACPTSSS